MESHDRGLDADHGDAAMTQDELDLKFRELRGFMRDELGDLRSDLRERVDGVNERLDVLNGRTRTSELAIAVLNDRSERAEQHARIWGGGAGAVVGGAIIAVWKWFSTGHP